eukprot:gnl/TRDRNA2_/TRDRNA2_132747_c0_seq2.p3 gnl/TRDRNA2_/TRDRNA2_132747_c0~~gnl/TRDRNA2_/TRDRNA2_132747_c0_seq2.p3  ORF type:complete len:110 (-),score=34.98 gnl/TRDRNA2_/TRDRNA2_132747_c0_seq2:94-423(-)
MSRCFALLFILLVGANAAYTRTKAKEAKASVAELVHHARHKQNPITVPEQGYDGKDIKHETMYTATGDWGTEYGPKEKKAAPPPPQKAAAAHIAVTGATLMAMLAAMSM